MLVDVRARCRCRRALLAARSEQTDDRLLVDGRTMLLRGVSHDLRSPLTTIKAISSDLMMSDASYDDGTRHELLGRVVDESDRLNRIVGNLLSAGRVQAGASEPAVRAGVDHAPRQPVRRPARSNRAPSTS